MTAPDLATVRPPDVVAVPAEAAPQRFRTDIQALRAVAVSLVVLNHLWPKWVPGGYVGVDVFFVISGYLITSHLRREVDATGRVRLATFWARRAKRLLPAAMSVLVCCVHFTVLWAPITAVRPALNQIAAAGTYSLNWLLAASSLDYFRAGMAGTTVTHYWSLSVEEQFYLIWPVIMVACALLVRKSRTGRKALMAIAIASVFAGSLFFAVQTVAIRPNAAYFETMGRAWEFAAGGLLTFAKRPGRSAWTIPVAWLAWLTLAYLGLRLDPLSGIPGLAALLPVGATALILWVRDNESPFAPTRLTSLAPVQFVGRVSYSLYLWHWPLILAVPMFLHHDLSMRSRLAVLVVSVALAYLSSRFIEDPVRLSRRRLLVAPRWVLCFTAASMALLLALTSLSTFVVDERADAAAKRLYDLSMTPDPCFGARALETPHCANLHSLTQEDAVLVDLTRQMRAVPDVTACVANQGDTVPRSCEFGWPASSGVLSIALVGDSHAEVWTHALERVAADGKVRVTTYLQAGCPPAFDDRLKYSRATNPVILDGCRTWRNAVIAKVASDPTVDMVITTSKDRSYVGPDGAPDNGDGYLAAWQLWLSAGKRVVAINDVPDYASSNIPNCIAARPTEVDPCTRPKAVVARVGPLALAAVREHDPLFHYVDFTTLFCDAKVCHPLIGGIPAYVDSNHLSAAFSRSMAGALRPLLMSGLDARPVE